MRRRLALFTVEMLLAGWMLFTPAATSAAAPPADLDPDSVLHIMASAADWQLAHPSTHPLDDWTQATFDAGVMALAEVVPDGKYLDAMRKMGETNQWRPGPQKHYADDWAVLATYAKLFMVDKDKRMLEPGLDLFNFLVTQPFNEPLIWQNDIVTRELAWCDALFMGPPALSAMTVATGDQKYLDLADRLWWKTTDYLYDKHEHLYFRDSRYFDSREPNGQKVFWSRGNGWVLAGLARLLQDMPATYPDRPRYEALFKDMAERVVSLQGPDGYWRSSLLDAESVPNPETSGTALFTYGLAWGINAGLLNKAHYKAAVQRGWPALVNAMHPDGMLGWVQPIGYEPATTTPDLTEVYGVGALLLAGSEVYRLT
ncbi:glycoside hydrolase family 105 protein [Mycolicibacterium sp. CH28]|uniref:glycoside hydrolase family 88/105 protein n=1 Tax=Mycolicibacterium sp. CH28 TaxID=2512237 RepID=UPI001386C643|nr:glycoside hydrolase family 88 protein [Mycolicibacterium sp. CH28]